MLAAAAVFIATLGYAVILRIPRRALWGAGLTGMLAWGASQGLGGASPLAAFAGALAAGIAGETLARVCKLPATVYSAPGVIVLVPGLSAYQAALAFARQDLATGASLALHVLAVGGSISGGLAVVVVAARYWAVWKKRRRTEATH